MTAADLQGTATGSVARAGVREEVVVDVTEVHRPAYAGKTCWAAGRFLAWTKTTKFKTLQRLFYTTL